jgi:hypothetical protein
VSAFKPITPERYAELLASVGLSEDALQRAVYAHCAVCGRQGYEHHDRDCGEFTPAIDAEVAP